MAVVVLFKLAKNDHGVLLLRIRMRSSSSRRPVPTRRSAMAFARGARTGVLMIRPSIAVKTESKTASGSRTRSGEVTSGFRPWVRTR
jgi:hypothetical protein